MFGAFDHYIHFVDTLSSHPIVLSLVFGSCALIKFLNLSLLYKNKVERVQRSEWYAFATLLATGIILDISWLLSVAHDNWAIANYQQVISVYRLSWIAFFIQYQSLGYLIERLSTNNNRFSFWHLLNWTAVGFFVTYFLWCMIWLYNVTDFHARTTELTILGYGGIYLYISIICNVVIVACRLYINELPRLINQQLRLCIFLFVIPYLFLEFIQQNPLEFHIQLLHRQQIAILSAVILTFTLLILTRRLLAVRFLNVARTVISNTPPHTHALHKALESLGHVHTTGAMQLVTQRFLYEQFNIAHERVELITEMTSPTAQSLHLMQSLQGYLTNNNAIRQYILQRKIVVLQDIEFDAFKNLNPVAHDLHQLMQQIKAEILLPVADNTTLLGYIVIQPETQAQLYSGYEQELMILYARYLSSFIHVLELRTLEHYKLSHQKLMHQLHEQQHRLQSLQESIRSCMHTSNNSAIGLWLYKNRHFIIGNQTAHDLIPFNLNLQEGHSVTKALRTLARSALQYRREQQAIITLHEQKFSCIAIPLVDTQQIALIMHPMGITDILQRQGPLMPHPNDWEYLLYLETTAAGQLINKLLPSTTPLATSLKIALAKGSFSAEPLVLHAATEDIEAIVGLIHHCSMRTTLQRFTLLQQTNHQEFVVRIGGVNPLLGKNLQEPLLTQCVQGTLAIENIEFLDHASQQYLVELINTGQYKPFKSNQAITTDVRLIFATQQPLQTLWQEKKIIEPFYQLLLQHTITIPSLQTMSEGELQHLALALAAQELPTDAPQKETPLNPHELTRLIGKRFMSIEQLRQAVHQTIKNKYRSVPSIRQHLYQEPTHIHDPELAAIAKLGKHALKDKLLMTKLWHEFKNQNKIATFLGVNRSSVNRRCKEFNLL